MSLIRSTPLALFPSMLGFFGLMLGWRRALTMMGEGELALYLPLIALPFFALAVLSYAGKLVLRPDVVMDDLKAPPARAALGALTMGIMLAAAVLVPFSKPLAEAVWWAGIVLHLGVIAVVTQVLRKSKGGWKAIGPALFLPYVGLVVAPMAGGPLGYGDLSSLILGLEMGPFAVILYLSFKNYNEEMAALLRPTLMIMLAPFVVIAVSAHTINLGWLFDALVLSSVPMMAWLFWRIRWMTASGFTPVWGAFTFPASATANVCLILAGQMGGMIALSGALVILVAVSVLILFILLRTLRMWPSGALAAKSGAATA